MVIIDGLPDNSGDNVLESFEQLDLQQWGVLGIFLYGCTNGSNGLFKFVI